MIIRLKDGVSLDHVRAELFYAIWRASIVWSQYGADTLWVVGGREQGHVTNPDLLRQFHWLPDGTCQAVDLRTWNIAELEGRKQACKSLAILLGREYDVIYEKPGEKGEHVHVQLDPERPGTV
jgi:hypothetical protein